MTHARMMHPRWRWIFAAGKIGQRVHTDGLATAFSSDSAIAQLVKTAEGKSKNKHQNKAFELYQVETTRMLIDGVLLSTGSVSEAAEILEYSNETIQWYSDWFFDIRVFGGVGDKVLYLDRVNQRDPVEASFLEKASTLTVAHWRTILKQEIQKSVTVQGFLTDQLNKSSTLADLFYPKNLGAYLDPSQRAEFLEGVKLWKEFSSHGIKIAETMLKGELDKTKEEFLQNFVMRLKDTDPGELIATVKPAALI